MFPEFVGNEENTSDGENEEVDESGDVEDVLAEDTEDGQSEESEEEEEEFEESDECDLTPDEDEEMGDLEVQWVCVGSVNVLLELFTCTCFQSPLDVCLAL